jgi:Response regulators consisting of a CheY-like receiver domain and a winged-helix DNA-binding domain
MINIVIVEDNPLVCEELVVRLELEGYETHGVDCGEELDLLLKERIVDLLIVDLNLPHEDGLSIVERVRTAWPQIRITILTARITPSDKESGYLSGADIYMSKPVRIKELLAAINSISRRIYSEIEDKTNQWQLDCHRMVLLLGNNRSLPLTPVECEILRYLATRPNRTASLDLLSEHLNLPLTEGGQNRLMVRMSRLRKKISAVEVHTDSIRMIRKEGYRLCFDLFIMQGQATRKLQRITSPL